MWWLAAAVVAMFMSTPLPGAAAEPSATLSRKAPEAAKIAQAADQQGYVSIIVEFAPPIPHSAMRPDPAVLEPLKAQVRSIQDAIIASHFGSAANPRPGRGFSRGIRRLDISPMFGVNVNAAELEALAADPRVLRIHENALKQPMLEQSVPLVGMPAAYTSGATGNGYAVAVVDSGVKADHPFLAGKVILEACFSKNGGAGSGTSTCPNGQPSQTGAGSASPTSAGCLNGATNLCAHGTHVAGIATGLNSTNVAGAPPNGVAKSADIVAIQVFTNINGSLSAYTTDIISGLNYVYSHLNSLPGGIKVAAVNLSLGGGGSTTACDSDPSKPSIDNLLAAGVATAIAAGNNSSTNSVSSPGCVSSAVTVGSSTKGDVISSFSNMASMVDLMAPGGAATGLCDGSVNSDIHSSLVTNTSSTFGCLAGTSMATPHVAGAFAALRTVAPNATVAQILGVLEGTGTPIQDTRSGGTVTKPRIHVDLAAQALINNSPVLLITPSSNIAASGSQGGPFSPASFQYQLSTSSGSVGYSISGLPNWLTASSTSGTATTSATTITFSVNGAANSLSAGSYGPTTITFTNTTNGFGNDTRTATLTVAPPPPSNDNFANAITIQAGQTLTGTNVSATKEASEPSLPFNSGGKSVWWKFTAPVSGSFTVDLSGSSFDTILGVFTGNAVNGLTLIVFDDDSGAGLTSLATFTAVAGTTYRIMVDGWNAASGNIQLALSAGPSATLVVTPLTDIAASGNQGGPFSPSSFQYQLNASTGSANYAISGLPAWLNVSSASGTVTTAPTTITFTVNSNANSLVGGTYNATISFANTSNGQGNQTRSAALTVNSPPPPPSAPRTWVSGTGDDNNDCSRAAPCLSFAGAIAKTAAGGEINCLNSSGYGGATITQSISIICDNVEAGVLMAGTNGITVNVASGNVVVLRGLDIEGAGTGLIGVSVIQSGTVHIEKCVIRGFNAGAAYGVQLTSTAAPTKLFITDSSIINNGTGAVGGGINIAPAAGGNADVVIKRAHITNNAAGVVANGSGNSSTNNVTIQDSEIVGNSNTGVLAVSSGSGAPAKVMINNSVLMANAPVAVTANGAAAVPGAGSAVVRIANSAIAANPSAQSVIGVGQVLSFKNNLVNGNTNNATPIPADTLN